MNVPHGRLLTLTWTQAQSPESPTGAIMVLRIEFRAPDGEVYHADLPNGDWVPNNAALQFLAKWGYKPSDVGPDGGTRRDCEPDQKLIPVAEHPPTNQWVLHQLSMKGADEELEEAEWFATVEELEERESEHSGSQVMPGGGNGDGGGGAAPRIELADEESDRGFNVVVE